MSFLGQFRKCFGANKKADEAEWKTVAEVENTGRVLLADGTSAKTSSPVVLKPGDKVLILNGTVLLTKWEDIKLILPVMAGENIFLYLVTLGVPIMQSLDGVTLLLDHDADDLKIPKIYTYNFGGEKLTRSNSILNLKEHASLRGLNLVMQDGYNESYDMLASVYTLEDEIGMLDWRAFQANPWSYLDPGEPDSNLWWGKGFDRYGVYCILGSNKALQKDDPESDLQPCFSARKDYTPDGNYSKLQIISAPIDEAFVPSYWGFGSGVGYFMGREEYLHPYARFVNNYILKAFNKKNKQFEEFQLAQDLNNGVPDIDNWTYYVPVVAVTNEKALLRKVRRIYTGDAESSECVNGADTTSEAVLTEELRLGDEVLETLSFVRNIQKTMLTSVSCNITGPDTMLSGTSQLYSLPIPTNLLGPAAKITWETDSPSVSSITPGGLLTLSSSACGTVTITATICDVSCSKEIRVADHGQWIFIDTTCLVYMSPPDYDVETILGGYKYVERYFCDFGPAVRCPDVPNYGIDQVTCPENKPYKYLILQNVFKWVC